MGVIANLWKKWFGGKSTGNQKFSTVSLFNPVFSSEVRAEMNATFISAVNAHARHLSKINLQVFRGEDAITSKKSLERILNLEPNPLMNAPAFWKAVARSYFLDNYIIMWLDWDYSNWKEPLRGIWPLDVSRNSLEVALDESGRVVIKFNIGGQVNYAFEDDLVILQRENNIADLFKGRSKAIDESLNVIQTSYQGLDQAIKASQFIRFIVRAPSNISPDMVKARQEEFAKQMFEDNKGIVYVSGGDDLKEVTSNGKWPLSAELQSFKNDIYEYLGVTPDIVKGKYNEDEWQSYYESTLEPFITELAAELTRKLFTREEQNRGNHIRVVADPLQTASLKTRVGIAEVIVKLPMVVPNNVLALLYQKGYDGGEKPQASLNWVDQDKKNKYQGLSPKDENPPSGEGEK